MKYRVMTGTYVDASRKIFKSQKRAINHLNKILNKEPNLTKKQISMSYSIEKLPEKHDLLTSIFWENVFIRPKLFPKKMKYKIRKMS